jgi:hypothetical protein
MRRRRGLAEAVIWVDIRLDAHGLKNCQTQLKMESEGMSSRGHGV